MQSLNISTAALRSVQYALDTTANNMANIDTVGYKKRGITFSELLADSMEEQPSTDRLRTTPPGLRIGSGVRVGLTPVDMSQGNAKETNIPTDLMIEGDGFFMVTRRFTDEQGVFLREEFRLTRNGAFHLSSAGEGADTNYLVNAAGDILVDEQGLPIEIPKDAEFTVQKDGQIIVNGEELGVRVPVWRVDNPDQYQQVGENEWLFPMQPGEQPATYFQEANATIRQGALETSNVNLQQEMAQLILTQRAFQLNSRAITIGDQMMGIANSLRNR